MSTTSPQALSPAATEVVGRSVDRPTALRRLADDKAMRWCALVIVALVVLSLTAPIWWSQSPTETDPLAALQAPTAEHPMGTDDVGRDMFARFLGGARISLISGLAVAFAGGFIGSLMGIAAALRGGFVDSLMMRIFDTLLAFPPLILAMAVTLALGTGLTTACIGIALSAVPYVGRIVRSDVLRVRASGYVEAARALGVPPRRIVRRHIVPHVMPTILVQLASIFAFGIVSVAALGFIGLGAQIPTPEWGATITSGAGLILSGEWWVGVFPGIGLVVLTAVAGVVADRIQATLDPHSRAHEVLV